MLQLWSMLSHFLGLIFFSYILVGELLMILRQYSLCRNTFFIPVLVAMYYTIDISKPHNVGKKK